MMLLVGGIVGTAGGVWVFQLLRSADLLDLVIALSYVVLLGTVGGLMVIEAVRAIVRSLSGLSGRAAPARQPHLAARPAVQDALQALENLRLGDSGARASASSSAFSAR